MNQTARGQGTFGGLISNSQHYYGRRTRAALACRSALGRSPSLSIEGPATIANIQILRALAAPAGVLHHLQSWLSDVFGAPHFALVGRAGVDFFFAISGFIMVYTNREGDRTATELSSWACWSISGSNAP